MLSMVRSLASAMFVLTLAVGPLAASGDRPVVRIPALEQGGQVQGDQMVDIVMKPADDGCPLLKLDVFIDNEAVIAFDLQPVMRNVTFSWVTTRWQDGRHDIVAKVVDSKGRAGTFRTFVYVWNKGKPTVSSKPATIEVQDTDGQPDGIVTQRALIQVKVDPRLGAKWVVLYLNDKMVAMMNYPPYQEVLDPARRHLADGPYVVRARVIHPDNSETYCDPVTIQVNQSGNLTPARPAVTQPGQPGVAAQPAPAPLGPATPPAPATVTPSPTAPPLVRPTDTPGPPRTSEAPVATGAPAPLEAARTMAAARQVLPPVAETGRVDLGGAPVVAGTDPAPTAGTVPSVPLRTATRPGKAVAQTRAPLGPRVPPRLGNGAQAETGVRDSLGAIGHVGGSDALTRLATPFSSSRLTPPRFGAGAGSPFGQPALAETVVVGAVGAAGTFNALPGSGLARPMTGTGLARTLVTGTAVYEGGVFTAAPSRTAMATPTGVRRGEPAMDRRAMGPVGEAAVAPAAGAAAVGAQAAVRSAGPQGQRAMAASGAAPQTAGQVVEAPVAVAAGPGMSSSRTSLTSATRPGLAPVVTSGGVAAAEPATGRNAEAAPAPLTGATRGAPVTPPLSRRLSGPGTTATIGKVHTVQRGETLAAVARHYRTSVRDLMRINGVSNVRQLRTGQRLVIPAGMTINGKPVRGDVPAVQQREGVTTSPLRFVVEALGGTVTWMGPETKQVTAKVQNRGVITFTVGSPQVQVNDEHVLMDLAAYIDSGRTMVPLRFIGQALDVTIQVDEDSGNITVRSNR